MKNDRRAPLARPPAAPPGPLPDASQLLQFVMEGAADGVFVAEATSKRLHLANPALCTLLGHTREELLTLQLADVMSDDPPPLAADAGQRIACGDEDKNRVTLMRKDGGRLRAMLRSSLLQRDGQQWLAGVLHDLSLSERATEAERLANHDSLTTLYNHRTFQQLLGKELDRAQRQGTPLSLLREPGTPLCLP